MVAFVRSLPGPVSPASAAHTSHTSPIFHQGKLLAVCMPRLSPALIHHARRIDPYLARLLPACRDLSSAKLELKWLREHSLERVTRTIRPGLGSQLSHKIVQKQIHHRQPLLAKLIKARSSGKPLQYVIGTEFFGDLEIQCREGVLIPRYLELSYIATFNIILNKLWLSSDF